MNYLKIRKKCQSLADKRKADIYYRYFQVKKEGYGYGDHFYGLTVPVCRVIARELSKTNFRDLKVLIKSKYHEERLISLFILIQQYQENREGVIDFYLTNLEKVNNWDLVDSSAYKLLGNYLLFKPEKKNILYSLIKSQSMWERRIALIATFSFIRNNQFKDTLKLVKQVLNDKEDLIHKAAGWMLREIGKRDQKSLIDFLNKYSEHMPRVMLRYSLEKVVNRQKYLK